jgi:hypothetical protein
MLQHSEHSKEVEIFTEDEIIKETNYLIGLTKSAT